MRDGEAKFRHNMLGIETVEYMDCSRTGIESVSRKLSSLALLEYPISST